MIAKTIEINWHDGQAVYSIDFSPDGIRFATAGADASVRLWSIKRQTDKLLNNKDNKQLPVNIDFLSELKRHSSPVNVVRFSPNGEYLASAGDDACIILWKLSANKETTFGSEYSEFEKESWSAVQMLYGHNKEIYDLAWSPCGEYFITASIDNTVRVWSVSERNAIHVFADHTHYVQGVAWDPLGKYVATQSSDRTVLIYKCRKGSNGRLQFGTCSKRYSHLDKNKIEREMNNNSVSADSSITSPSTAAIDETTVTIGTYRFYHDENLVSFFRRLAFSPDGGFLITPAGLHKNNTSEYIIGSNDDDMLNCSYIFPRNTILKYPIAYTGNHNKPSIAVKWCNQVYEKRTTKRSSLFNLPYRLIYAVATQDSVYIYDTQQEHPICALSGMHYAPITDLSWSKDGNILTFSSADGYCSVAVFNENELGTPSLENIMSYKIQDEEMLDINTVIPTPSSISSTLSPQLPTTSLPLPPLSSSSPIVFKVDDSVNKSNSSSDNNNSNNYKNNNNLIPSQSKLDKWKVQSSNPSSPSSSSSSPSLSLNKSNSLPTSPTSKKRITPMLISSPLSNDSITNNNNSTNNIKHLSNTSTTINDLQQQVKKRRIAPTLVTTFKPFTSDASDKL